MLDSLMKFGAHRVNYFEALNEHNPEAFGFYIRAEIPAGQAYSHEAKYQLYAGLDLIQRCLGMKNLAGIYVDIDCLKNLQRPAYQQLRRDVLSGHFRRILVLNRLSISGCPGSDRDLSELSAQVGGVELLVWQHSGLSALPVGGPLPELLEVSG
jgi:hypothetical protein